MKRSLSLALVLTLVGGAAFLVRLNSSRETAPVANAAVARVEPPPPRVVAPAAASAEIISAPPPPAKAPSLQPGVRNDFSDDDMRFLLERIDAGDRELAGLYKEYLEKLKRADFKAEVATVARSEGPPLSKTAETLVAMDIRIAESDLNEARNRIQQLIYHRRRNTP